MAGRMLIHWTTADGEEHDERWDSIEAFRRWAAIQGLALRFTAYGLDEDDQEWVVVDQGRISPTRPG
jgi:hypothetical protein